MASQQALSTLISRHECCQYFSVLEKGLNHVIDGIKTVSDLSLSPPPIQPRLLVIILVSQTLFVAKF